MESCGLVPRGAGNRAFWLAGSRLCIGQASLKAEILTIEQEKRGFLVAESKCVCPAVCTGRLDSGGEADRIGGDSDEHLGFYPGGVHETGAKSSPPARPSRRAGRR